jgi:hypothetical protein
MFDCYHALPPGNDDEPAAGGALLMAVAISTIVFLILALALMIAGATLFCGG